MYFFDLMIAVDTIATTGADHLPQFPFLGEFATQDAEVGHEVHADRNDGFFGGNGTIGRDAEFEFGEHGVRDLRFG